MNNFSFQCDSCETWHEMSGYAVAQLAMGHEINFTGCDCGDTTTLLPDDIN
jgi:hypothetical protein